MSEPSLPKEYIERVVPGAVVLSNHEGHGDRRVEVRLEGPVDAEVLGVLVAAIEGLGFWVMNAFASQVFSEVMDEAVKATVLGVFGEGLAENAAVLFVADVVGGIAGQLAPNPEFPAV
jgi:hypothetical protein